MDTDKDTNVTVVVVDSLQDKVAALICVLTGQDALFTAYDITKQLRGENPTMNIPHQDVRDLVLEEFNNTFCDEYEITMTELTVGQYANVYHPETVSPKKHPLAVQDAPATDDTELTVEKRLNVGKDLLQSMGLTAGKIAKVSTTNGVMSIEATTDTSGDTLVVNADGRLRLGEKMITEAFGHLPAKYSISFSFDRTAIEVKPKK